MLTDEDIELGGYRFEDLQEKRIVENRTDLLRKQTDLGFPRPIKTGASQAMFLKSEVHAWLRGRAALRDAKILHNAENPVALPHPVGRPKTVPVPQRAGDTVGENGAKSTQARLNGIWKVRKNRKQPRREKAVQDVVAAPPPAPSPSPPPPLLRRQQPSQRDSLASLREAARKRRGAA